jgi:hypothetical protein
MIRMDYGGQDGGKAEDTESTESNELIIVGGPSRADPLA